MRMAPLSTYPSSPAGASGSRRLQDVLKTQIDQREQRRKCEAALAQQLPGTLAAIEHGDDSSDVASRGLRCLDGAKAGGARGRDIFDDHDPVARPQRTFDELAGAVVLAFLADQEP